MKKTTLIFGLLSIGIFSSCSVAAETQAEAEKAFEDAANVKYVVCPAIATCGKSSPNGAGGTTGINTCMAYGGQGQVHGMSKTAIRVAGIAVDGQYQLSSVKIKDDGRYFECEYTNNHVNTIKFPIDFNDENSVVIPSENFNSETGVCASEVGTPTDNNFCKMIRAKLK